MHRRILFGILAGWVLAGWILAGRAGAGGDQALFECACWKHEEFQGAPSFSVFGAYLPDLEPDTRVIVTLGHDGFEGSAPRRLDSDRILFAKVPIGEFGEYTWRVTTEAEDLLYAGSIVVEPGPWTGAPCSRGHIRELAAQAEQPEPLPDVAPDLAPGEEPPVASPPVEGEEFPWEWVIVGGGVGGAAGAALLAASRKTAAAEPTAAAGGGVLGPVREEAEPSPTRTALTTTAAGEAPVPGPSARGGPVLRVTLRVDPPGTLEEPVERGDRLTLHATVLNEGGEEATTPQLAFFRLDRREEGEELAKRNLGASLSPRSTVNGEIEGKSEAGPPVMPGLTRMTFVAVASATNAAPARSEEVTVHVGHPVLQVGLTAEPARSVREGTEVRYRVRVENAGRAPAKDVKGTFAAACASPKGDGRDSWERTFEVDELDPYTSHEEEFAITPWALGAAGAATLRASASAEAKESARAESESIETSVTPTLD